jgi:hypothetical protein
MLDFFFFLSPSPLFYKYDIAIAMITEEANEGRKKKKKDLKRREQTC